MFPKIGGLFWLDAVERCENRLKSLNFGRFFLLPLSGSLKIGVLLDKIKRCENWLEKFEFSAIFLLPPKIRWGFFKLDVVKNVWKSDWKVRFLGDFFLVTSASLKIGDFYWTRLKLPAVRRTEGRDLYRLSPRRKRIRTLIGWYIHTISLVGTSSNSKKRRRDCGPKRASARLQYMKNWLKSLNFGRFSCDQNVSPIFGALWTKLKDSRNGLKGSIFKRFSSAVRVTIANFGCGRGKPVKIKWGGVALSKKHRKSFCFETIFTNNGTEETTRKAFCFWFLKGGRLPTNNNFAILGKSDPSWTGLKDVKNGSKSPIFGTNFSGSF